VIVLDKICLGPFERPGGLDITGRGIEICAFPEGACLADIGCGGSETLRYLEKLGYRVTGVDFNSEYHSESDKSPIITANAEKLPFPDSGMDGLIFECSLSKMNRPDAVLSECRRVLMPGGRLMISDMYSRGRGDVLGGMLGRVDTKEEILKRIEIFGFELLIFEDHSDKLMDMWARLVFENGRDALCSNLGTTCSALKEIKCGYYLAVFRKKTDTVSTVDRWISFLTGQVSSLTPDKLREWQLQKIRDTIALAAKGDFYGNRLFGIDSDKIKSFEDFEKLPFTTSDDLSKEHASFLRISPSSVKRIVTQRTSGTTGEMKRMYFTEGDVKRTEEFFTYALSDYVRSGQKAIVFLSNETEDGIGDLLKRAFYRIGVETKIHGYINDIGSAASAARGSDFFIGMPAEMLKLCRAVPELNPGVVLLSADYVPDSIINSLEKTWGCDVIRHFGMTETCFGCAVDCNEAGGQHIRHGDFYIEIINPDNGKPVPNGEVGEIVITTLSNEALPLIRYKTGDMGNLDYEVCACGGVLPRLGKVLGRIQNLGSPLNIHGLDELIFSFDSVNAYEAGFKDGKLMLTVDGGEVPVDLIEQAYGVNVSVNYSKLEQSSGNKKRKLN